MSPPSDEPAEGPGRASPCPACGTGLPVGAVPPCSIVLCARCCATLLWDGVYKLASASDIANLRDEDRARLVALIAIQHAQLESSRFTN